MIPKIAYLGFLPFLLSSFGPPTAFSQQSAPGPCDGPEIRAFDFLPGSWHGEERRIVAADTTLVATADVEIRSVLGGCALQESWSIFEANGTKLFDAVLTRAYDRAAGKWMLNYTDTFLNYQIYEGREEGGFWRFYRERTENGRPLVVRITWEPSATGFSQTIERSEDSGRTWVLRSIITYERND